MNTRFPALNRSGVRVKRDQVWQRPFVEEHAAAIAGDLDAMVRTKGEEAAIRAAADEASLLRRDQTLQGSLYSVLFAREALLRNARCNVLSPRIVGTLHRSTLATLQAHNVKPERSRLSFLYRDLHQAVGQAAAFQGDAWQARWEAAVGQFRAGSGGLPDAGDVVRGSSLALRAGFADQALGRLLDAELTGLEGLALSALRIARARILRLCGRLDEAESLLQALGDEGEDDVAWERAWIETHRSGVPGPLFARLRQRGAERSPHRLLLLWLAAHASRSKTWLAQITKPTSLRRRFRDALDEPTLACAIRMERAHAARGPLDARVAIMGRALGAVDEVADVQARLLLWAAGARWLIRAKHPELAAVPLLAYRASSSGLSAGEGDDALGLMADVDLTGARGRAKASGPATSRTSRMGLTSKLIVDLARTHGRGLAENLFRGTDEDSPSDRLAELAEILAAHLGVLKGPLMKLGQLVSLYGFDLPEEVATALDTLQDDVPGVGEAQVRQRIEAELGGSLEDHFADFSPAPLATGSLGQVHAAVLPDGRRVAVKVQYPGIEAAVRSDLANARLLRPFLGPLLPSFDLVAVLEEIGRLMLEECDYRTEAAHQAFFHDACTRWPNIRVPAVVPSHSGRTVLTSEFVDGLPFADFCASADQAQRDRAGEILVRFVATGTLQLGRFNTDIHPGNVLFDGDDIVFVDFGSVHAWGPTSHDFQGVLRAVLEDDADAFAAAFRTLGFLADDDGTDLGEYFELVRGGALASIREDRRVPFHGGDVRREVEVIVGGHARTGRIQMPPSVVYGFRAYWGLFALLVRLRAENNWRRLLLELLDGW